MAQKGAVAFQQPGQVAGAASPEPQQGNATEPQYVTVEEARRLAEEAAEAAYRKAQSLVDQNSNKFNKEVRSRLDNLESAWKLQESAGVTITDEQKERMRQRIIQDVATAPEPEAKQPEKAQPGSDDLEEPSVVNAKVTGLYQRYGMQVFEGEPEAAGLDYSSGAAFIQSLEAALIAKQARLSPGTAAPDRQPSRTPTNAGATGAVAKPDLESQYRQELNMIPRGDAGRMAELKAKYRQKGLEVW